MRLSYLYLKDETKKAKTGKLSTGRDRTLSKNISEALNPCIQRKLEKIQNQKNMLFGQSSCPGAVRWCTQFMLTG
jgi:hypothetical protein